MIVANQLKNTSRAEFLLYMWQVEDIIRAYDCDIERLTEGYLQRFEVDESTQKELYAWYEHLCTMMKEEGLRNGGHLQINQNILADLNELNVQLLKSPKFPYYSEMYYKVLPFIVELRSKGCNTNDSELLVCFNALYGYMMLKLKQQDISTDTQQAVKHISTLLGQLSDYYKQNKIEPIDFE